MKRTPAQTTAAGSEFPLLPTEVISVLLALGLVAAHAIQFIHTPTLWHWLTPVVFLGGLLAADFVSGLVHWVGDTWGDERTPWLGARFIKPFRFHHAHPLDMLKSNFFTTNGDTALASLPFLLVAFAVPQASFPEALLALFLASVGAWGMWTSQFHQWAHQKSPSPPVAWLQRRGLILSPQHHQKHHKVPFVANYCIPTGWCDPVLQHLRFFQALEWLVSRGTGWQPRRKATPSTPEPGGPFRSTCSR